jgi:hypothetical protein
VRMPVGKVNLTVESRNFLRETSSATAARRNCQYVAFPNDSGVSLPHTSQISIRLVSMWRRVEPERPAQKSSLKLDFWVDV